jgi:hypothetical protein
MIRISSSPFHIVKTHEYFYEAKAHVLSLSDSFELCSDLSTYARFRIHPLGFTDGGFAVNLGAIPCRRKSLSHRQKNGASVLFPSASVICVLDCGESSLKTTPRWFLSLVFKPLLLFRVSIPERLLHFPFLVSKHGGPQ